MLNDRLVSSQLGVDPVTAAAAAASLLKTTGILSVGPTPEFQKRENLRKAISAMITKVEAMLPGMPANVQTVVKADIAELRARVNRENMKADDYRNAISWFEGRSALWPTIQPEAGVSQPKTSVTITAPTTLKKGKVVTEPETGQKVIVPVDTPTTIIENRMTGERVEVPTTKIYGAATPAVTTPVSAAPVVKEAGFPWPVAALVIGGLLLLKK